MRSLKETSSLIKKWERFGLEYSNDPKMMAFCFEYTVKLLPESEISINDGMIIPIIFRVINKIKPIFKRESRKIVKDVIDTFPHFLEGNINIIKVSGMEWEAEMCALFTDEYLLKHENT